MSNKNIAAQSELFIGALVHSYVQYSVHVYYREQKIIMQNIFLCIL